MGKYSDGEEKYFQLPLGFFNFYDDSITKKSKTLKGKTDREKIGEATPLFFKLSFPPFQLYLQGAFLSYNDNCFFSLRVNEDENTDYLF